MTRRMNCGSTKKKKKNGAGHKGRTLYLDKEGGFNSANCPWQVHDTLQCAGSHFVIAILPMPIASSTALSGWNPQVSMLTVWLKEKRRKRSIRLKPRPIAGTKIVLQRVAKASQS